MTHYLMSQDFEAPETDNVNFTVQCEVIEKAMGWFTLHLVMSLDVDRDQ